MESTFPADVVQRHQKLFDDGYLCQNYMLYQVVSVEIGWHSHILCDWLPFSVGCRSQKMIGRQIPLANVWACWK